MLPDGKGTDMGKNETATHVCEQYRGALANEECTYCVDEITKHPWRKKWIPVDELPPEYPTTPDERLINATYDKAQAATAKAKKENILEEANRVTSGDRRKAYGKASKQLMLLARLWEPILGKEVQPIQVALCLLQLKVSRELHAHSRDNIVDIAGYARVIEMLFDGE